MKPTIRCSSLDRILTCPGSLTLAEIVDARRGSEGTEGTALHWLAHKRMVDDLGAVGDIGLQPAMPASVEVNKWISDYYFRAVQELVPPEWSLQVEVPLAFEFGQFNLSGHMDALGISPDGTEAIVADLKTGYDPVDGADENEQVFGYDALLLRAYPSLLKITSYIIQPRNDEDEGYPRISEPSVLEAGRLAAALPTFEDRINAVLAQPMLLRTGKQCKWCVGCSCPCLRKELTNMELTLTPETLAEIKATPNDAVLGDFVISARNLAKAIEDARTLAKERIEANGTLTSGSGTIITQKTQKGAYTVVRPLELWNTVAELLTVEGRAGAAKWSMSALKDAFAKEMSIPKTGKAAVTADSIFDAKIRTHVEQGEKKIFQFS